MRSSPVLLTVLCVLMAACARRPLPEPQVAIPPPEAPPSEQAAPVIPTGLTAEQVRPVLEQMQAAVRGCHAMEFGGQEQADGTLRLEWVILPSGAVDDVKIVDSTFESEVFAGCVLEKARQLEFPQATGPTAVSKPYTLHRTSSTVAPGDGA